MPVGADAAGAFWALGLEMQSPAEIPEGISLPEISKNASKSLRAAPRSESRLLTPRRGSSNKPS